MNKSLIFISHIILISLILCCSNYKPDLAVSENEEIYFYTPPFRLKTIPEGLLITLSDITDDISSIHVEIVNWGDKDFTYQNNNYPSRHHDIITSSYSMITGNSLEHIKQTNKIVFPFVKKGEKYNVLVTYSKPGYACASTPYMNIIADNGIYFDRDIELVLNDEKTNVCFSEEPKFSTSIGYNIISKYFYFQLYNEIMSSTLGSITTDNNNILSWDFEPSISEQIKRSNEMKKIHEPEENICMQGDYTAIIGFYINAIYDEIEWYNDLIKSPSFNYPVF